MVFDWEGNIVECFCQDEQRRKIVNIDLFHLTKISGTSRGLESLSEGLLNFTEAGKEWEVVAEAESLLVVSAVVEWKPDLGSYLKVYLGARKSWVWMGARQPFLVHSTRKWVNVCVFQSWCWAFLWHLWKAMSDSLPGAARVVTVQESWSSQGLHLVIGIGSCGLAVLP